MLRNLKALGLAITAMFALSAMTAVAAQANEEGHIVSAFETDEHEISNIFATDENEDNDLVFTSPGGVVDCAVNDFHGTLGNEGTEKRLTLEATFGGAKVGSGCTAAGFPATVFNNGCHLTFYTAETTAETTSEVGEWRVTTDLHCPDGQPGIVVKAYSGGAHGFQVCQIVVPPQTELEGVTIHNKANTPSEPHDLTATVDVEGIHETQSGLCGSGEGEATMEGEVTITAESEEFKDPIDLYVEHTEPEE